MQTQNHPTTACNAAAPNLPAIVGANPLEGTTIRDPSRASGTTMAICSGHES